MGRPISPWPGPSSSVSSVSSRILRERHETALDRLLAELENRLLRLAQGLLRVETAVQAVARDVAADVDQPAPYRALLDDLDVRLEAPEVGQVDVEASHVADAPGILELVPVLELRLQRAQVDRRVVLLQLEHRRVETAMAVGEEVVGLQATGDGRQQTGIEQDGGEHGALGLFTVRQRLRRLEQIEHEAKPTRSGRRPSRSAGSV